MHPFTAKFTTLCAAAIALAAILPGIASAHPAPHDSTILLMSRRGDGDGPGIREIIVRAPRGGGSNGGAIQFAWDDLDRIPFWPFQAAIPGKDGSFVRDAVISNDALPPVEVRVSVSKEGGAPAFGVRCGIWGISLDGERSMRPDDEATTGISGILLAGRGRALLCDDAPTPVASEMAFVRELALAPWFKTEGSRDGVERIETAWAEIDRGR